MKPTMLGKVRFFHAMTINAMARMAMESALSERSHALYIARQFLLPFFYAVQIAR